MPVIQHVKLGKYTILVLERSTKEQFGLKQQLKMVAAELLNVLRHDNVDGFPDNDESSGLEQLLVTPFWMFLFQNIAHPVVFPEPDSGVHHEPRYQAKSLLTDSQTHVFGHFRRIDHVHLDVFDRGGIHFTVNHLILHFSVFEETQLSLFFWRLSIDVVEIHLEIQSGDRENEYPDVVKQMMANWTRHTLFLPHVPVL
nr:protein UL7 [synthetic construct]